MDNVKILVVEDDLEINRLVSEHLSREGYSAVSAFNGVDAIQKLSSCPFELVIPDISRQGRQGDGSFVCKDNLLSAHYQTHKCDKVPVLLSQEARQENRPLVPPLSHEIFP